MIRGEPSVMLPQGSQSPMQPIQDTHTAPVPVQTGFSLTEGASGYKIGIKDSCFRILAGNLNGFPRNAKDDKNTFLRSYINAVDADVVSISELNRAWHLLPVKDRMEERTYGWFESLHISKAYFRSYPSISGNQYGGTAVWSINTGAHRVLDSGSDHRGLGRWTWTRYRGRQGRSLRVVSAYRPVDNKSGVSSVWSQQKGYFEEKGDLRCPRTIFIADLVDEVAEWLSSGDHIVISVDANERIRGGLLQKSLRSQGLVEIFTFQSSQPETSYERGSDTIDGLFVSPSLQSCKCGFLPFTSVLDHRWFWIDIPISLAFGSNIPPVVARRRRRLRKDDPRTTSKYIATLKQLLESHNLFNRIDKLQSSCHCPLTPEEQIEYDAIDYFALTARLSAEKKCRKLKVGAVPWSPVYQQQRNQVLALSLAIRRKEKGQQSVDSRYFQRILKRAGIKTDLDSLETLHVRLKLALKAVRISAQTAELARQSWLDLLAKARASHSGNTIENEIAQLKTREKQRRDFRIIKRCLGAAFGSGLTSVEAPGPNDTWIELTLQADIEKACCQENSRRFNQAKDTPFLQEPLFSAVGPMGFGPAVPSILKGAYSPPDGIDPYARKLLPHLAQVPLGMIKPLTLAVSTENHTALWKQTNEQTSAGPSGTTYAQYIAGCSDPAVAAFDAAMRDIPYRTGFSPNLWRYGTNVMLPKKRNNIRVDSLRAILLYEAAFNANNKQLGRDMLRTAEMLNAIAVEQYGSRRNHSAVDQVLNRGLTSDVIRQLRIPAAFCSNDAKSCYDRIVHSVASICMQRVHVPEQPIRSMFTTIQNLEHRIRTAYGDSKTGFSGALWDIPIQGVGQGNGAGPQIWALVSTPVFNLLRSEGFGCYFQSPISGTEVKFVAYGFVDDVDQVETAKKGETYQEVAARMQKSVNCWSGGIRATGGCLVPSKSSWTLIDFKWQGGNWSYAPVHDCPATLEMIDVSGIRQRLKRLKVSDAERTLGVRLAADGNCDTEKEYLLSKTSAWADAIRTGVLPRALTWLSLQTTILKSLQYPLPATTFSEKDCADILRPLLYQALPSSGFVPTFPRVLVYGPKKHLGLEIPNLYVAQGIQHIHRLIRFSHSKAITASLFLASIEVAKLELGIPGPFFSLNYSDWSFLSTPTWCKHTWEFLSNNGLRLEDTLDDISLAREGDVYLMAEMQKQGLSPSQLIRLNKCRLYLQVSLLSDITTGDGRMLLDGIVQGQKDKCLTFDRQWMNQGPPTPSDWLLWQQVLLQKFCSRGRLLKYPLGGWTNTKECVWFYSGASDRLYSVQKLHLLSYRRRPGRPSRNAPARFHCEGVQEPILPFDATPTKVYRVQDTIISTGFCSVISSTPTQQPVSFLDYVQKQVHPDAKWAISCLSAAGPVESLAVAISNGTCIAVSDGSFKSSFGTAAWIIQGISIDIEIQGRSVVPGSPSDQSSYRSELAGLYGIAVMVDLLCQFFQISAGSIEVCCDGKEALRKGFDLNKEINPYSPQFDLLGALQFLVRKSNITWIPIHVLGHQDDMDIELDRKALLNIQMDAAAKEHWQRSYNMTTSQWRIYGEPWSLWQGNKKICLPINKVITDIIHGPPAMQYWENKGFGGLGTGNSQEATRLALQSVPLSRQHWITKFTSGFCAVGRMMKRRKKWTSATCPRCGIAEETNMHVLRCSDPAAILIRKKSLLSLQLKLLDTETPPEVARFLTMRISQWLSDIPPVGPAPLIIELAASEQDTAGWKPFVFGMPVSSWESSMSSYFLSIGSRRSGLRWLSAIIKKMYDVSWDMWQHRNEVIHSTTQGLSSQSLQLQVRHELSLGCAHFSPDSRRLFHNRVLQWPIAQQHAWLVRIRAARQIARDHDETSERLTAERRLMRAWLGPTTQG